MDENEKQVQKPFSLLYEDFEKSISELINNSGLPISVVECIFKNVLNMLHNVSIQQLQIDKERYDKLLNKNNGDIKQ